MKLRSLPEDFVVSERIDRQPASGPFALYRLRKTSIGTLEALGWVRRQWNLTGAQVSHAGLKDRHAVTTQYVTIRGGPAADCEQDTFQLSYAGQTASPLTAGDILRNDFSIVVRALDPKRISGLTAAGERVAANGFTNYFDAQRFGSLGESQKFIAASWCMKDYEKALWLALAEHNSHDDAEEREQKTILRDHWHDWAECKKRLGRSHRRSVVTYLVDHPDKFRKAFALINGDLRGLYLSAFQSAVWNRMLSLAVRRATESWDPMRIGDCDVSVPSARLSLDPDFAGMPLPSVRCRKLSPQVRRLCDEALEPYEMNLRQMKVHYPRDRWFSRAMRQAVIAPVNLQMESDPDECHPGRTKMTLQFGLPRGCYATMLIKTIFEPCERRIG